MKDDELEFLQVLILQRYFLIIVVPMLDIEQGYIRHGWWGI